MPGRGGAPAGPLADTSPSRASVGVVARRPAPAPGPRRGRAGFGERVKSVAEASVRLRHSDRDRRVLRVMTPPMTEFGLPPDDEPFDFADERCLKVYLKESANLARSRCALPEYLMMARAETGLYATLHRLKARVPMSRIVRKYLPKG